MTAAAGPYLAGCILLVVAGAAKLRQPTATQRALAVLISRAKAVPGWFVRGAGVAELSIGAAGLVTGGPGAAAAVAACYLAFAGFAVAALSRGGAGCGCFGESSATADLGPLHVVVNVALAGAALTVAAGGGLASAGADRAVLSVLAVPLAWVTYLVLVPLPRLLAAVRQARR